MELELPVTRYARSGDVSIAYQVLGDGPFDVVWVPGAFSHVELNWTVPNRAEFNRRLASFCRLIMFDKRGTGMSDRAGIANLETRMDDVRAVMDGAGSERAALFGVSEGGPMCTLFAATYPERTWGLILFASFPREMWAPDYPFGCTDEAWRREYEEVERRAGDPSFFSEIAEALAPSAESESKRKLADLIRQSGTPAARIELMRMNREIDVRPILPVIRVPTLVLNRAQDDPANVQGSRYLAEHIPGARHVELDGADHAPSSGDAEPVLQEMQGFLEDAWRASTELDDHESVLATILFTDIVGSTQKMTELGNRVWSKVLSEHHAVVRRQLLRYRGMEMDTAGDGFFARFDGPARAIRCAREIVESVRPLGLEVRAGLHTGECELNEGKISGIAVSVGARVAAEASANEVLVSSTVRDLVAGSGLDFVDRGARPLKGVPGEWQLYAVAQ
ncbi:MAG: adenylate/guanylate cyclase domain-containing protein [Actinomycetota bacterium]|nr:adenylate/guanylate cyclase domain-containing protein [Actinomycetota bacterium]